MKQYWVEPLQMAMSLSMPFSCAFILCQMLKQWQKSNTGNKDTLNRGVKVSNEKYNSISWSLQCHMTSLFWCIWIKFISVPYYCSVLEIQQLNNALIIAWGRWWSAGRDVEVTEDTGVHGHFLVCTNKIKVMAQTIYFPLPLLGLLSSLSAITFVVCI